MQILQRLWETSFNTLIINFYSLFLIETFIISRLLPLVLPLCTLQSTMLCLLDKHLSDPDWQLLGSPRSVPCPGKGSPVPPNSFHRAGTACPGCPGDPVLTLPCLSGSALSSTPGFVWWVKGNCPSLGLMTMLLLTQLGLLLAFMAIKDTPVAHVQPLVPRSFWAEQRV